jgi:hypothetical protein
MPTRRKLVLTAGITGAFAATVSFLKPVLEHVFHIIVADELVKVLEAITAREWSLVGGGVVVALLASALTAVFYRRKIAVLRADGLKAAVKSESDIGMLHDQILTMGDKIAETEPYQKILDEVVALTTKLRKTENAATRR